MRAVVGKHVGLWFLLLLASQSLPARDEPVLALPVLKYSKWRRSCHVLCSLSNNHVDLVEVLAACMWLRECVCVCVLYIL